MRVCDQTGVVPLNVCNTFSYHPSRPWLSFDQSHLLFLIELVHSLLTRWKCSFFFMFLLLIICCIRREFRSQIQLIIRFANLEEIIQPLNQLPLEFSAEEWAELRSDSLTLIDTNLTISPQWWKNSNWHRKWRTDRWRS